MLAAGQLDQALNSRLIRKSGYSRLVAAGLVILALPLLWFDFQIVAEPYQAALPQVDRYQYIEGPWNATGLAEVTTFLEKEQTQANKSVVLFTTQTIPSLGLGLEFYKNTHFKLIGVDLVPNIDYVRLNEAFGDLPAYFVSMSPTETELVQEYRRIYPNLDFVPVLTVPKPGNLVSWQVYRLDRK